MVTGVHGVEKDLTRLSNKNKNKQLNVIRDMVEFRPTKFIYLSFVWGEMGENQIQRAILAAVGRKKGMSVSPERIPCIVALAP